MKKLQLAGALCAGLILLGFVPMADATTIDTGQLSYDSGTSIITSTTGITYLGFEIADARNYDYVLSTILTNPLYSGYHIASQAEAYEFYNLAIDPISAVVDTAADQTLTTSIAGVRDRFGPSLFRNYSSYGNFAPAFFLSDDGSTNIGVIRSYDGSIVIDDHWANLPSTYYHTYGNGHEDLYSWLIVNNTVPEPTLPLLFAIGLVGIAAVRRRTLHC